MTPVPFLSFLRGEQNVVSIKENYKDGGNLLNNKNINYNTTIEKTPRNVRHIEPLKKGIEG